jgi:hypothetical protein
MHNRVLKNCVLMVLALALFGSSSYGQRPGCGTAESEKADLEASRLSTWDALFHSYKRFSACDDGSIAEGYSESVGRILTDRWETLPRLAVISAANKGFQKFVLRHVDATLDSRDLKRIRANASHRCTAGEESLCEQLATAANKALKE